MKPPSMFKSTSHMVSSRTQLTLHAIRRTPHGASGLVQALLGWSVKARRAPSRHCRDARVYRHATTAIHDIHYSPLCLVGLNDKLIQQKSAQYKVNTSFQFI